MIVIRDKLSTAKVLDQGTNYQGTTGRGMAEADFLAEKKNTKVAVGRGCIKHQISCDSRPAADQPS